MQSARLLEVMMEMMIPGATLESVQFSPHKLHLLI